MANPKHSELLQTSRPWKNQGTAFKIMRFARKKIERKKKKGDQWLAFISHWV